MQTITLPKSAKYLEIILDECLSFTQHINQKCAKATILLISARTATGSVWDNAKSRELDYLTSGVANATVQMNRLGDYNLRWKSSTPAKAAASTKTDGWLYEEYAL